MKLKYYQNNILPISFFNSNTIDKKMASLQKKVFEKYNLPINIFDSNTSHSDFLDYALKTFSAEVYIIFDIDCIPLTNELFDKIIRYESLHGIAQRANHKNNGNHLYAGPACLVVPNKIYQKIGMPSFRENIRGDVAEELTWRCEENNIKVELMMPTQSENKKWHLKDNIYFGNGTVYDNIVYHAFESFSNPNVFINKCNKLLNENGFIPL